VKILPVELEELDGRTVKDGRLEPVADVEMEWL